MSNNMDDLLNQLKTEYQQPKKPQANSHQPLPSKRSPDKPQADKSIQQMLDELGAEILSGRGKPGYKEAATTTSQQPASDKEAVRKAQQEREALIAEIERDYRQQERKREALIAAKKRQEQELIAAQKRREEELIAAQKQAELREQRRKAALREKAQKWLQNLNPSTEEGKWFEEFSYSYESKLQAAIDYLEAMEESGL